MNATQDVLLAHLREYYGLGWAVTPVWWIDDDGRCACGREGCPPSNAGKHPMLSDWQTSRLSSWADIETAWRGWPRANIGVLTGEPSGHWVLDYDPGNADAAARALLAELPPPHVVTGSGGWHWRFTMGTGSPASNSPGRLPPGFDVRSTGGYVVAPPSRSGKGGYFELSSAPAWDAPATVAEMVRPVEREMVSVGSAPISSPYASAAIDGVLNEIRGLPGGRRNAEGWRLARRVRELAAGAEVDAEHYGPAVIDALMAAGLGQGEASNLWHVKSVRRPIEPARATGGVELIMQPAAGSPTTPLGNMVTFPQVNGTTPVLNGGVVMPVRPSLASRLLRRSELDAIPEPRPLIHDVINFDSDVWLIGASGSGKSFVALDWACHVATGRPWAGSAVERGPVLYVAAEGASGLRQRLDAWEREHQPVGDELAILPVSVRAVQPRGFTVTDEWRELEALAAELRPALIVLDTQARMTTGLSENDAGQMGAWVDAVTELRAASGGACVLVVHHTGRNGGDARGSTALDAAQDAEWTVTRDDAPGSRRIKLACTKNKDGRDDAVYAGDLILVESLSPGRYGPRSSLVVRYDPKGAARAVQYDHQAHPGTNQQEVLEVLRDLRTPGGDTKAEIRRKVNELREKRGVKPMGWSSLDSALSRPDRDGGGLLEKGKVQMIGRRWELIEETTDAIPLAAGAWVQP